MPIVIDPDTGTGSTKPYDEDDSQQTPPPPSENLAPVPFDPYAPPPPDQTPAPTPETNPISNAGGREANVDTPSQSQVSSTSSTSNLPRLDTGLPNNMAAGYDAYIATINSPEVQIANVESQQSYYNKQVEAFNTKQQAISNEIKAFNAKWSKYIKGNTFTGSEEEYEKYKAEAAQLESKQETLNQEVAGLNKTQQHIEEIAAKADTAFKDKYVRVAHGDYVSREFYESLPEKYKKALRDQGLKGYERLVNYEYMKLPDGSMISRLDYNLLDEKYQKIATTSGFDAMKSQMDIDSKIQEAALKVLEPYKDKDGGYNLNQYLLDAKSPGKAIEIMRDAGFKQEDIVAVTRENLKQAQLNQEQVKQAYSIPNLVKSVALDSLPVIGTIRYAKDVSQDRWSNGEKALFALSVVGDIATVIPFVGAVSAGARAGGFARSASTIAKAEARIGVGSRLAGASRGAYEFALSEIKSPFTTILHPIDTAKAMVAPLKLLKKSHVPLASLEVSDTIIKVPVEMLSDVKYLGKEKYAGDIKTAIRTGDEFTQNAIRGTNAWTDTGKAQVKVRPTVASKLGEPVIIHTTDNINPFVDQAKTNKGINKVVGEDKSIESALFGTSSAPEDITYRTNIPLPPGKFTEQYKKLTKFTAQDIAKIDVDAYRELNLSDSKVIPQDVAKGIEDIIRDTDSSITGSFVEWIKNPKIRTKPNDVDIVVKDGLKQSVKQRIYNLLVSKGYKAKIEPKGVYININGKMESVANVIKESDHKAMMQGIFDPQVGNRVNGIRTEAYGSQVLAQGLGSNSKDAKALTRKLKFNKDAELVLVGTKGHTKLLFKFPGGAIYKKATAATVKKVPGGLIFRGEDEIKKFQSSNKLWQGTREDELALAVDKEFQVKQWITTTRTDGTTLRFGVVGKPFTNAELAKMKLFGTTETVKQIWSPAVSIRDSKTGKKIQILQGQLDNAQDKLAQLRRTNAPRAKISSATRNVNALTSRIGRLQSRLSNRSVTANAIVITSDRSPVRELNRASSNRVSRVSNRTTATTRATRPTRVDYERLVERASNEIVRSTKTTPVNSTKPRTTNVKYDPNFNRPVIIKRSAIRTKTPINLRVPERLRTPVRLVLPGKGKNVVDIRSSEDKNKRKMELFKGAITWKQGFGWWAIKAPYKSKGDVAFFYREPPPNAQNVSGGVGSALRSIQVLTGKPPSKLTVDLGIQDIVIEKGKSIRYTRDTKQKTSSDIRIANVSAVRAIRQPKHKKKVENWGDSF